MKWLKRKLHWFFLGSIALSAGIVPIVPDDMPWVVSYETVAFNTADNDLALDQYAVYGATYFYRVSPKDVSGVLSTTSSSVINGKTEVSILCEKCRYYEEFWDGSKKQRFATTSEGYNGLRYTNNYPQPKKTANKSIFETLIPEAEATASYDNSTGGSAGAGTSLSFSHTNGAGADAMLLGIITGYANTTGMACTYNSVSMRLIERREYKGGPQGDFFELVTEEGDTVATGANTASCSWTTSATPHMQVISGNAVDGGIDSPKGANSSWVTNPTTFSTTTELDQTLDADDIMVGLFFDDKASAGTFSQSDTVALESCSANWCTGSNYGTDGTLTITESITGNPNLLGALTVIFNGTSAGGGATAQVEDIGILWYPFF